jgi:hypothetical protein
MTIVKRIMLSFICALLIFPEITARAIPSDRIAERSNAFRSHDNNETAYRLIVPDDGANHTGLIFDSVSKNKGAIAIHRSRLNEVIQLDDVHKKGSKLQIPDSVFRMWPNPASWFIYISMNEGFPEEFRVVVKIGDGLRLMHKRSTAERVRLSLDFLKESDICVVSMMTVQEMLSKKLPALK